MSQFIPLLQRIWRRMPVSRSLRATVGPVLWHLVIAHGRANLRRTSDAAAVVAGPLIVSANLSDNTGIGRAGRLTVRAVEAWGVPFSVHDIPADPQALQVPRDLPPGGVWLAHCNPPEAAVVLSQETQHLWATRYRIGYWAYELPELPRFWARAIPFFHEIWTPSRFVADAVERARGKAATIVRVMPHPVAIEAAVVRSTEHRPLTFLTMFDARSSAARKNPLGSIAAFQQAFAPDDAGVRLRIKITASWKDSRAVQAIRDTVAGWPNIELLDEDLSDDDTRRLFAEADCVVSLHRAEGFGLPLAEAMVNGLPVIATDWSGNVDLTRGAGFAVPYRMVRAVDSTGRYNGTGQDWADPDIGAAAVLMRQVRDDPAQREEMAERGRRRVAELCSGLPHEAVAALLAPAAGTMAGHRP